MTDTHKPTQSRGPQSEEPGMYGKGSRMMQHLRRFEGAAEGAGVKSGRPLTRDEAAALMTGGPIDEKAGGGPG